MRMTIRLIPLAFMVFLVTASPRATSQEAVLSGMRLNYVSTNTVSVSPGYAYVKGALVTVAATLTSSNKVVLAANSIYYAYVACGALTLVKATPPSQSGLGPLIMCGTPPLTAFVNGIFVGSVLTDGLPSIIPFTRTGDRVLLAPSYFPPNGNNAQLPFAQVGFFPTDAAPSTKPLRWNFVGSPNNALPATATGVIVEIVYQDTDILANRDINFLLPGFNGPVGVGGCRVNSQFELNSQYDGSGTTEIDAKRHAILSVDPAVGSVAVVACAIPAKPNQVVIDTWMHGYIEGLTYFGK